MNGLELFTHATNVNSFDDDATAEGMLEEMRDGENDHPRYTENLEKALLYYAGFDVLEVEEAYENDE